MSSDLVRRSLHEILAVAGVLQSPLHPVGQSRLAVQVQWMGARERIDARKDSAECLAQARNLLALADIVAAGRMALDQFRNDRVGELVNFLGGDGLRQLFS